MNEATRKPLHLAFDVGHSSLGWSVLGGASGDVPRLLGCGAVTFQADDCLASARRAYRRQRRHVRATRLRIARLGRLLSHLGVLSPAQVAAPGCAWPWLLAARVLRGGPKLNWPELWDVLRWYAHNRGYDGNKGWSRHDAASTEDSDKEAHANELLAEFETRHGRPGTMAEVFCDRLGVDPLGSKKSSIARVRNLNAAFPREGVEAEVERILRGHLNVLPLCDQRFIQAVTRDHTALPGPDYRLPLRYGQRMADGSLSPGGLLFGQLVPRFDNRIIARCPLTFEKVYQEIKAAGGGKERAAHEAEKHAKVPSVNSAEFHRFRWAMQLANVKIAQAGLQEPRPLTAAERLAIHEKMLQRGFLTAKEFREAVRTQTGGARNNLEQLLTHPEAERALVLDPARRYLHTHPILSQLAPLLPAEIYKRLLGKLRRGHPVTLAQLLAWAPQIDAAVNGFLDRENTKKRKNEENVTRDSLLRTVLHLRPPSGRAPHTRAIMQAVVEYVFAHDRHPAAEGGPLFRSEAIRSAQLNRKLDEQTNNHLVRHRLKLLDRLHADLLAEYASGDRSRVAKITIEVNRDLRAMSGKTAQEQAKEQGQQLAHFQKVAKKLSADYSGLGVHIGPGLIRKGRIADDLNWTCPYTGKTYDALDLFHRRVDKDHIIPRSMRESDSLASLVITFSEINKWKGQRTAARFVEEEQCKPVPGMPNLFIKTFTAYQKDILALETFKGHEDDQRRKKKRKELFLLRDYLEKEFTPKDLTQTSQLVRLGAQTLEKHYQDLDSRPVVTSLPGSVTGVVRRSWNLLGCLASANELVLDPGALDESGHPKIRTKTEIRGITHLHHALDACVLAFASYFLPRDGGAWELLVKRRLSGDEQRRARELFKDRIEITPQGSLQLADIPSSLKNQLRLRLQERRVVQHLPVDVSGLRCKETVWRIFDPSDPHPNALRLGRWLAATNVPIPAPEAKTVVIICRKRKDASAQEGENAGGKVFHEGKTWRWLYDVKDKTALLGLTPEGDPADAKLKRIKAVKVLGDNFGLALDPGPDPVLIRPHKVWHHLEKLRMAHGGKPVRVLRKGSVVRIPKKGIRPQYEGVWVIRGVTLNQRAGFLVDLSPADQIVYRRQPGSRENVSVSTLLRCGLEVLKAPLCGIRPGP